MFQPFYFLFFKGNSLLGKITKSVTKGKYSHVALFLDSYHLLETAWNNPSVISHFNYKKNTYDIYKVNAYMTDEQKEIILDHIRLNIRVGYDFVFVITRGLNILLGTKVINSRKFKSCDELIIEAFDKAGIKLHSEASILTPDSLSQSKRLTALKQKETGQLR